jgi:hypothetical protein
VTVTLRNLQNSPKTKTWQNGYGTIARKSLECPARQIKNAKKLYKYFLVFTLYKTFIVFYNILKTKKIKNYFYRLLKKLK